MKKLNQEIFKVAQSWELKLLLDYNGKKIRIRIRRNSIDSQSFAKAEIWSNEAWNEIDFIPTPNMITLKTISVYDKSCLIEGFQADVNTLKDRIKMILS